MELIDYIVIIIYLTVLVLAGFFARRKIGSMDDFLLAGKRFNALSLAGTIVTSIIGAGMTLGVFSSVYTYGSGMIWNFIGLSAGCIFVAFIGPRLRQSSGKSMAEVISGKHGRTPRFWCGIFTAIYSFSIMSIGVLGLIRIITYLDISGIDQEKAAIIISVVAIGLTALGGLYSVVWTDTLQFIIMIAVFVVVGPIIAISQVGSLTAINAALTQVGGSLVNPVRNVPLSYVLFAFLTTALSVPCDPAVPQRVLAGKNDSVVRNAFWVSAGMSLAMGLGLLVIGGGTMILSPNVAELYGTDEAALPVFILNYFPPALKGLAVSALLAAILSTITSELLVGTTHLVYDVGHSLFPQLKESSLKKMMPIGILVFGLLSVYVSMKIPSIKTILYFAFSFCGAAFLFPMLGTLYWKNISNMGVTFGVIGGAFTVLILYLSGLNGVGGDPVYTGLLVSLAFCIGFSIIFPDKSSKVS